MALNVNMPEKKFEGRVSKIGIKDVTKDFPVKNEEFSPSLTNVNIAGKVFQVEDLSKPAKAYYVDPVELTKAAYYERHLEPKDVSINKILCTEHTTYRHIQEISLSSTSSEYRKEWWYDYGINLSLFDLKSNSKITITDTTYNTTNREYVDPEPEISADETKIAFKVGTGRDLAQDDEVLSQYDDVGQRTIESRARRYLRGYTDIIVVDLANKKEINVTNSDRSHSYWRHSSSSYRFDRVYQKYVNAGPVKNVDLPKDSCWSDYGDKDNEFFNYQDPTFSPDGKYLAFSGIIDGHSRSYIFLLDLEQKKLFNVTNTKDTSEDEPRFINNDKLGFLSKGKDGREEFLSYDLKKHTTSKVMATDLNKDKIITKARTDGYFFHFMAADEKGYHHNERRLISELYVDGPFNYGDNPIISTVGGGWSAPVASRDGKKIVLSADDKQNNNNLYIITPQQAK